MPRTLSTTFRRALFAAQTGEVFLTLLTISNATLPVPIRVVNDGRNLTSNGQEYLRFPFEAGVPDDTDDGPPVLTLRICNVDRQIVTAVREAVGDITCSIQIVLASSPDTVEVALPPFTLRNVRYDAEVVEGDLMYEDVLNEPSPPDGFGPNHFPGLY